jgi:hypothetical protein
MSIRDFERACITGTRSAFDLHWQFTGGLPLGYAPEAFIQGQIALELAKLNVYVSLESHVYDALKEAGGEMRGRPVKRVGGRIDLVTWWKSGKPRILIEIKKLVHKESISADVRRLRQVLGRGGSTRHGIIVTYTSAKKPETIRGRIDYASRVSRCKITNTTGPIEFPLSWREGIAWNYEVTCFRVEA